MVKRYEARQWNDQFGMVECKKGDMVKYEDYSALEQQLREVQGQLERLARAYATLTDKDK